MPNRGLLLIVALAAVCASGVLTEDCEPNCEGLSLGDFVADPSDCTQYYLCLGDDKPSDKPYPCPDGTFFEDSTSSCSGSGECVSTCTPAECHITCDGIPDVIADPKDCGVLYICTADSVMGPFSCPVDKPFFNGTSCGTDYSACCGDMCTPYCFAEEGNVPDPLDCAKYYRCLAVGPVDESLHLDCPSGQNFDLPTGECAEGAACTVLCDDLVVTTTPAEGGSTASAAVTSTSGCLDSLTCTEVGYFAQCSTCQREYFHCTTVGEAALLEKCTGTLVFNPDPDYAYCVLPSNCPYHPPI